MKLRIILQKVEKMNKIEKMNRIEKIMKNVWKLEIVMKV